MVIPIVLAAGLSRRMGAENKLLLPFGDSTVLETTLENILRGGFEQAVIVVGHESEQIKAVLNALLIPTLGNATLGKLSKFPQRERENENKSDLKVNLPPLSIIDNFEFEIGMTSSIKVGVLFLKSQSSPTLPNHYAICLSDMPHLLPTDYQVLTTAFLEKIKTDSKAIVQPTFKGERGNPTLLAHFYTEQILGLEFTEGCRPIVKANSQHVHLVEMPTDACLRDADFLSEMIAW